ncbi:TVP38/TMEM64 family protein [Pseudalkalibacillus berkeleyi]|uniref:TVP38/TMEM64 family membrane protein n=1 Tax=Pseudalkalibacillus berkeleyi TaxID=1069813 RepID=A0ABS9GXK0_9BACL|nr:TVP38/TMEM64 family protein [Pseudalkalibacillus berkeleyi]MCF6137424.1 TVP38/TMEM64 family protein [Pseudalkalibacillus berkeleyi]
MKTLFNYKWLKWLLISVFVVFAMWFSTTQLNLDAKEIRDWIIGFGIFAPIIYMLFYTVRPLIFFPASILSITGGLAFGPLFGTIYTVLGATAGALVSFIIARKLGKNVANKEWKGRGKAIQSQLEKNGFFYVLLFRFIPLFNFDLISYTAGVSKVRFRDFFIGTLIGIIPGTFAYNFLGSSLVSGDPKIILFAIIVFAILTVIPMWVRKKWLNKKEGVLKDETV